MRTDETKPLGRADRGCAVRVGCRHEGGGLRARPQRDRPDAQSPGREGSPGKRRWRPNTGERPSRMRCTPPRCRTGRRVATRASGARRARAIARAVRHGLNRAPNARLCATTTRSFVAKPTKTSLPSFTSHRAKRSSGTTLGVRSARRCFFSRLRAFQVDHWYGLPEEILVGEPNDLKIPDAVSAKSDVPGQ